MALHGPYKDITEADSNRKSAWRMYQEGFSRMHPDSCGVIPTKILSREHTETHLSCTERISRLFFKIKDLCGLT
jgi:hypothetical protein